MQSINKKLLKSLEHANTFQEWKQYLIPLRNKEKGDLFEYFTYYLLKLHPYFQTGNRFDKVWLYKDIPNSVMMKLGLPKTDKGIDLLCQKGDKFWGVQCKFRSNENEIIRWKDLATFPGLSMMCNVNKLIFVTNCHDVGDDMKKEVCTNIHGSFWDTISKTYIKNLKRVLKGEESKKEIYKPLLHQTEFINKAELYFLDHTVGKIIAAPGTGKTLTSKFIAERLGCEDICIAVPSLLLLSQFFLEWYSQMDFEPLLIGSSTSDDVNEIPGLITTTDQDTIEEWLLENEEYYRVVFTTYDSAHLIKNAAKNTGTVFDLTIFDEAHKTVGSKGKKFATLLDWDHTLKKLSMTATPKVYTGTKDNVYCMDDAEVYGETIHELGLRAAIERGLLTDYRIITPVTSSEQIEEFIQKRGIVIVDREEYPSNLVASAILLIKSIMNHPNEIKKILTYHNSIKEAKQFCQLVKELREYFYLDINCNTLDGSHSMNKREKVFQEFRESGLAFISSARVLNEGVNIKCVDSVVFVSPRKSMIDIIQCIGRAFRLYKGKDIANIIIPSIVDEDDSFNKLWTIVRSIGSQDDVLIEYFRERAGGRGGSSVRWVVEGIVEEDIGVEIDVNEWYDKMELKCWNRLDGWYIRYCELKEWVDENERLPSLTSKNKIEKKIAIWCSNNRQIYSKNKLNNDRIRLLESIEIWWWKEDYFYEDFYKLKKWMKIHNGLPSHHSKNKIEKSLGNWCSKQKIKYKRGKMINNQIKLLESINGWWWKKEDSFLKKYKELKNWIQINNKFPSLTSKNKIEKTLANWCSKRRQNYKNGKITDRQIGLLESIKDWWWGEQTKQNIIPFNARIKKLNEWMKINNKLPIYPSKDKTENSLGSWCCQQRKNYKNNKLSDDKIKLLENINGWWWEKEDPFLTSFKELKKWVMINEKMPTNGKNPIEKRLRKWCYRQKENYRKGKLSEEKIKLLESVDGWWWEKGDPFYIKLNELREYIRINKKVPPDSSKDKIEKSLGVWCAYLRNRYRKGKLSDDKIKLLESVDGWWWEKPKKTKKSPHVPDGII